MKNNNKKFKIPNISPDRLDTSPPDTSRGPGKDDRRAHSFIKGREPTQTTSLRVPESKWEKLKLISFATKKSFNNLILKSIDYYLSTDEAKKTLAKAKRTINL